MTFRTALRAFEQYGILLGRYAILPIQLGTLRLSSLSLLAAKLMSATFDTSPSLSSRIEFLDDVA